MAEKPQQKRTKSTFSRAEVAGLMRLSASRVSQLAQEGILEQDSRGTYPREQTLIAIINFFREAAELGSLRKEKLQKQNALLDRALAANEMVPRSEFDRTVDNLVIHVRQGFLELPAKLSGRLPYLNSELEIETEIRGEIETILRQLAQAQLPAPSDDTERRPDEDTL